MKTLLLSTVATLVFGLSASNSIGAGDILQPQTGGELNISFYAPIGQTFTATTAGISIIGFKVTPANTINSSTVFTYQLLEGAGTSGPVVASRSFSVPAGFTGYADADFSPVTLTVGQVYTVLITASDFDFAVYWNQWATDPGGVPISGKVDYTGGEAIDSGQFMPHEDLTFHVLAAAVYPAALIPFGISPAGTDAAIGLSPANEVPAVLNSTGSGGSISGGLVFDPGSGTLMLAVGYGSAAGFTDLTGPATSLTLNGPAGTNQNAGMLSDLAPLSFPAVNPAQGGVIFGRVFVSTNDVPDLLAGLDYINIGTATNASGEIRGQLIPLLPTIVCPDATTVQCGSPATVQVGVSDPAGYAMTVVWSLNGIPVQTNQVPASHPPVATNVVFSAELPSGINLIEVVVTDSADNTASCSTTVTVVDTIAPVFQRASASPNTLWPPNHKMVTVTVSAVVTDNCGPVGWKIIGVQSNEPVKGLGDGNTAPDWQILGNHTVSLRAERSGTGSGRVYTITLRASDASGNLSAPKKVTVTVPKSQGKNK